MILNEKKGRSIVMVMRARESILAHFEFLIGNGFWVSLLVAGDMGAVLITDDRRPSAKKKPR